MGHRGVSKFSKGHLGLLEKDPFVIVMLPEPFEVFLFLTEAAGRKGYQEPQIGHHEAKESLARLTTVVLRFLQKG